MKNIILICVSLAFAGCSLTTNKTFTVNYSITGDIPNILDSTIINGIVVSELTYGFDHADTITFTDSSGTKTIYNQKLPWSTTVNFSVPDKKLQIITLKATKAVTGNGSIKNIGKLNGSINGCTSNDSGISEATALNQIASLSLSGNLNNGYIDDSNIIYY